VDLKRQPTYLDHVAGAMSMGLNCQPTDKAI
jgi:hypothetical protein